MVKVTGYSKQVYEQIVQDLVKEEAEALKHQTLVSEYKKKLVEGKKKIIEKLILGKKLFVDKKNVMVFSVQFSEEDNKLGVVVTVGLNPFKETMPSGLTKKEEQLLEQYKIGYCYNSKDGKMLEYFLQTINNLSTLKNAIDQARCYYWTIDVDDAAQPDFFSKSGLTTGVYRGASSTELMFEDLTKEWFVGKCE